MPDQSAHRPGLSEISHLFLSSVRQKQLGSTPAPRRKPPARKPSIDLTPEEIQHVMGAQSTDQPIPLPPVTALIASHLGPNQLDSARLYARHLAAAGKRVGLIAIDTPELRIFRFDPQDACESAEPIEAGCFDPRVIAEAINELSCDLDRWLLLVENPRVTEARTLLRQIDRWVALCPVDHEGIVACYRTFKGLSDLHPAGPKLRLAVLNTTTDAEADAVFRRLAGVCQQFLNWKLTCDGPVHDAPAVAESPIISCQVSHDKAQLADTSHWQVVSDFLARAKTSTELDDEPIPVQPSAPQSSPTLTVSTQEPTMPTMQPHHDPALVAGPSLPEVIDLPESTTSESALIPLLIQHWNGEVIETPVRPPMCPDARLAVSRDRRLVLIAAAGQAMADLKTISLAYRWLIENRALLGMALPQFSLDPHQLPHLRLLIDQADANPDILRTVLSPDTVTIHTYRRVKWGPRTGLLLDAA